MTRNYVFLNSLATELSYQGAESQWASCMEELYCESEGKMLCTCNIHLPLLTEGTFAHSL